jgi:hypothetical protein
MSEAQEHGIEDIEACARDGRAPRAVGPYRISIGDALLNFQPLIASESVLAGRSLLGLAGLRPVEEYALFAVMTDGLLEEIRLEEVIDLRAGVERLLAFKSDRIFRFMMDGREYHWGGDFISGATLMSLAKLDAASHALWLVGAGGSERAVGPKQLVDLGQPGVETFVTRRLAAT